MRQVTWDQLVPGRQYRIEHIRGLLAPVLGTFIQNDHLGPVVHSTFNKLISQMGRERNSLTSTTFTSHEWNYFESGKSLVAEQTARGL